MDENGHLTQLMTELGTSVKNAVDVGLASSRFEPELRTYSRWLIDAFEYNENGPGASSAHLENVQAQTWFIAVEKVQQEARDSLAYKESLASLLSAFGDNAINARLDRFVYRIASDYFETGKFDADLVKGLADVILKELHDQPIRHWSEVWLTGTVLGTNKIEFGSGQVMRKITKEDLEKNQLGDSPLARTFLFPAASAILEIEMQSTSNLEVQKAVEKTIAMLRLFSAIGVSYSYCRNYSEALWPPFGAVSYPGNAGNPLGKFLVRDAEAKRFKRFWQAFQGRIPEAFYLPPGGREEDHVTISYRHYCDSLMQDGLIERRVANSIMGLEALLLKPGGEQQELTYRLKNRIAKLLGNFSYDPLGVQKVVSDAYSVRSTFAHGSRLSYKDKTKLEGRYGSVDALLIKVLGYLRACMIVSTVVPLGKDAFINLIDASLVDSKKNEQLGGTLETSRPILQELEAGDVPLSSLRT